MKIDSLNSHNLFLIIITILLTQYFIYLIIYSLTIILNIVPMIMIIFIASIIIDLITDLLIIPSIIAIMVLNLSSISIAHSI